MAQARQYSESIASVTETPPTIAKPPLFEQDVTDKPDNLTDNHGFKVENIDAMIYYEGLPHAHSVTLGHAPGKWSPDDITYQHKCLADKLRDIDGKLKHGGVAPH